MIPIEPTVPIIQKDGRMTAVFRAFMLQLFEQSLIIGTGNPEGFLDAGIGKFYMDDTGTSGSILYIKQQEEISGDRKKGWVLI